MNKSFGNSIIDFLFNLDPPEKVPQGVNVLNPYRDPEVKRVVKSFYSKYYDDSNPRVFLIGINPGRFGGGITGIPFTDPIRLGDICNISNPFNRRPELSSNFIYQLIEKFGGARSFYQHFYFSAVSPLGFVRDGKNLNYYDIPELQKKWEPFMIRCLTRQMEIGGIKRIAFGLGQGKNFKYLTQLNDRLGLFDELKPLPHPRWVMQYRLKKLDYFLELFKDQLEGAI